jgi:2-polyprenyl-3-methyl-5-hydroxy-6-metoxy-1,4-benzoquinol methylase
MEASVGASPAMRAFDDEVARGGRYRFGRNWARFLELLNDDRITAAERSLVGMLGLERLEGKTFLDIGSGSGLFSLAARRLGARVTSFDFDPDSVGCTKALKERFFAEDQSWSVLQGSVLDPQFVEALPGHDVVYSWGVLHHTGHLHEALVRASGRVAPGGLLFLALYRKTWLCRFWKIEKRAYVACPPWVQGGMRALFKGTVGLAHRLTRPGASPPRGMDYDRDIDDWLGGYPYESITPTELKTFMRSRGFELVRQNVKSEGIHITPGCDEFLFRRVSKS